MTIKVAIQCTDKRTLQIGTFGYFEDKPFYSVTPVFTDYGLLVAYCKQHDIKTNYNNKLVNSYWKKIKSNVKGI